jgi:hypothetical protein
VRTKPWILKLAREKIKEKNARCVALSSLVD